MVKETLRRLILICGVLSFGLSGDVIAKTTLDVAVSISTSAQREAYYSMIREFENTNPDIQVNLTAYTSEIYKESFPDLLGNEQNFDILYWHAGELLKEFVKQGQVSAINEVWQKENWDHAFDDSVVTLLADRGLIYGLPISCYQIGFYYRKSLFNHLQITAPKTWEELLEVSRILKQQSIAPIFIGTHSNWPATAWFDYLNLRINGLDFHQKLMRGEASFLSPKLTTVFETWLQLIEPGYFIDGHQHFDWKDGLPSVYRGLSGMTMVGNYVIQDIPEGVIDDIGFFPFPRINDKLAQFEEAPLDILLVPQNAQNKKAAYRFLAHAGSSKVQSRLNKVLGVISPHRNAQVGSSELVKEAYKALSSSAGFSQFFDRDAHKEFADSAMPLLDAFMLNKNVAATQKALEQVRAYAFDNLTD